jgi:hypothetical protein
VPQTDEFTPTVGWNTVNIQTPTLLPAGTYWLAFLPESDELAFKFEWNPGSYTGQMYGYPYGELPSSVSGSPVGVEYRYSFYATLIEDNSITPPETGILDDFNRADGPIGSNWSGFTSAFNIGSNQLLANTGGLDNHIYWGNESFSEDQEAYVTISQVNTENWELSLMLKSQSNTSYEDGAIEVFYLANTDLLQVWSFDSNSGWIQYGADIPVVFSNGDQFAARTYSDGKLELYKNDVLFAIRNMSSWAFSGSGGYIGVWFANAANQALDDFGGGSLSGGEMMMASSFSASRVDTASGVSTEFIVVSSQFRPATDFDSVFLRGASAAAGQKAYVILTMKNSGEQVILERSQRDRRQRDGDIQVLYDIAGQRIQILKYDSQTGWVQQGRDIRVRFVDRDRFRVQAEANGVVEMYRNGKLLLRRNVVP